MRGCPKCRTCVILRFEININLRVARDGDSSHGTYGELVVWTGPAEVNINGQRVAGDLRNDGLASFRANDSISQGREQVKHVIAVGVVVNQVRMRRVHWSWQHLDAIDKEAVDRPATASRRFPINLPYCYRYVRLQSAESSKKDVIQHIPTQHNAIQSLAKSRSIMSALKHHFCPQDPYFVVPHVLICLHTLHTVCCVSFSPGK